MEETQNEAKLSAEQGRRQAGKIEVRELKPEEEERFEELMAQRHYLGEAKRVGDFLRQVVLRDGKWVGLLVWGPAAYRLKDRDNWIGWSSSQRLERLKLIAQNRRFLLLSQKGAEPNLASQALGAACRALPQQWQERFGYQPLLAESFTDLELHKGTCYKASGWQAIGMSAGYSRHRADFYIANQQPKKLWCKELCPQARERLCRLSLLEQDQKGAVQTANGVLPLNPTQARSLFEWLRRVPDPRANNAQFGIGAVLTLICMAILAGARDIAQIARFATRLHPQQRSALGLPPKPGTRRCFRVPGYSVFYQVLSRMDAEELAQHLTQWLQSQAGTLPAALALDGKMIRDCIGMVSLAEQTDGSPVAFGIMDQKEATTRCEQTAARQLLEKVPSLDEKVVSADALHCQKATARLIVEKGGDYVLQIKANQRTVLAEAKRLAQVTPPFLPKPIAATDGSKNARSLWPPLIH
jgi:hypothetical protein